MRRRFIATSGIVSLALGLILLGCSQYSQKPASVAFHNLSANYNAYFIASAKLDSAERIIRTNYKENYNLVLPILLPLDSTLSLPAAPFLKDAIQKASMVAEKHQNSKWVDNSYTLIGKARLYLGQFSDGVEALRYVVTKSDEPDDRNEALIALLRAYAEQKDYSNALSVSEFIREQPLNKQATIDFYLTKAYLHQKVEEDLTAVAILEQALPLMSKSVQKARLHYIAGQLYDKLKQPQLANAHYAKVSKNKPHYDLDFYAQMNGFQNDALAQSGTSLSGFEKMLKDRKNTDLKDKIYYTMAIISERKGDYVGAMDYFQKSVRSGGRASQQVPFTYLEMARLNLEVLEKPDIAKMYFDSAMAQMPTQHPSYKAITERKQVLDQFVAQQTIIRTEDSLQVLALLSPEARAVRIDKVIADMQEVKRAAFEKSLKELEAAKKDKGQPMSPLSGPRWVLYDPSQVAQGKTEFTRKWGNRPLSDDWRRLNRTITTVSANGDSTNSGAALIAGKPVFAAIEKGSEAWNSQFADLLRNVPLTDSAMALSHTRKQEALYTLGKIYWNTFKDSEKTVSTYNRLLKEYPSTSYKQEVYYLLYLSAQEGSVARDNWKQKILSEYPNSIYARFISNTNDDSLGASAKESYEKAYNLYAAGKYADALTLVENGVAVYRNDATVDRLALLRLFIIGKIQGAEAYKSAILEFMKLYPESQYLSRTKEMLQAAERAAVLPRN